MNNELKVSLDFMLFRIPYETNEISELDCSMSTICSIDERLILD